MQEASRWLQETFRACTFQQRFCNRMLVKVPVIVSGDILWLYYITIMQVLFFSNFLLFSNFGHFVNFFDYKKIILFICFYCEFCTSNSRGGAIISTTNVITILPIIKWINIYFKFITLPLSHYQSCKHFQLGPQLSSLC